MRKGLPVCYSLGGGKMQPFKSLPLARLYWAQTGYHAMSVFVRRGKAGKMYRIVQFLDKRELPDYCGL